MSNTEKEYRAVVNAIGASLLLFLILFHVLYGGVISMRNIIVAQFADFDTVYIASELLCYAVYGIVFTLPVIFFCAITKGINRNPIDLTLKMPENHPGFSFIAIIFSGLAVIIASVYLNKFLVRVPPAVSADLFGNIKDIKPYAYALSFLGSAVIPAFVEELLFRALIISSLKPYSRKGAVIVSTIAFGLMHQNPLQILYATVAGVVLALVYLKTESIWCCIALHFANNFVSVLQSVAVSLFGEETVKEIIVYVDIAVIVIGVIFGLILLTMSLKTKKETHTFCKGNPLLEQEEQLSARRIFSGVFLNPAVCLFALISIGATIVKGFEIYIM